MKIAKKYIKNIFCLEGDWDKDLRKKSSVRAALVFMSQVYGVDFIHRHCGTKAEIEYYLSVWKQKRYEEYSIVYFAFHGEPYNIKVGRRFKMNLDELADILENSCKDKIIHFGSCRTLDINNEKIRGFLRKTQALCVCGYRSDVEFIESTVFDLLLLNKFQDYRDIRCVFRDMKKQYSGMVKSLKFKYVFI